MALVVWTLIKRICKPEEGTPKLEDCIFVSISYFLFGGDESKMHNLDALKEEEGARLFT